MSEFGEWIPARTPPDDMGDYLCLIEKLCFREDDFKPYTLRYQKILFYKPDTLEAIIEGTGDPYATLWGSVDGEVIAWMELPSCRTAQYEVEEREK